MVVEFSHVCRDVTEGGWSHCQLSIDSCLLNQYPATSQVVDEERRPFRHLLALMIVRYYYGLDEGHISWYDGLNSTQHQIDVHKFRKQKLDESMMRVEQKKQLNVIKPFSPVCTSKCYGEQVSNKKTYC
jgi:hypothetical protein